MPENSSNKPRNTIVIASSETKRHKISRYLVEKNGIDVLSIDSASARDISDWCNHDVVIFFVDDVDDILLKLSDTQSTPSLVMLYEADEEDRAYSIVDDRIVDILPMNSINRLPFILRRESQLIQTKHELHEQRKAMDRLRSIIEDQSDLICRYTPDFRLTFANRAYSRQYEKTPEEIVGASLLNMIPESDQDRAKAHVLALNKDRPVATSEHRSVLPDGSVSWQQWVDRVIFDDEDNIIEYQGVGRDITDRKQEQNKLELQSLALDHLLVGFDIIGEDGLFIYANQTYLDMWGYDHVDEVIGTSPKEHCADPTIPQQIIENLMQKGTYTLEFTAKRKDGSTFDVLMSAQFLTTQTGQTFFFGSSTDITASKQAKKVLLETEQRLRLFVEHAPAAIAMFDKKMNYLLVSQRWLQDYQLQETDIIGRSHYDVFPDIPDRWRDIHRRCLNGAIESSEADAFPRIDGSTDWIRWEIRPWHDANGSIGGILLFSEVITERIEAQSELKALYEATSALFSADDLSSLGKQIVETVVKVFDQADCGFMLLDDSSEEIIRVARAGQYNLRPKQQLTLSGAGLVSQAMRSGEIVYAPDVSIEPDYVANESRTKSELVIPLRTSKGVIGALDLQHVEANAFQESDQRILKAFAERAGLAIATMRLNESLGRYAADLEDQVKERTADIERGRTRVEAILNNSPDAILLLNDNLHIQQANKQFHTIFGCSEAYCFGKSLTMLVHPNAMEELKNFIQNNSEMQNSKSLELQAVRQDGTSFDAEISVGVIKDEGVVCVIRDITERKAQERQLRYFASFQEHISDAVVATDTEFHIVSWNKAAEDIYGWTAEEVIGKTVRDVLHTQHPNGMSRDTAKKELAEANEWHNEVRQKHKNGDWLDISASVSKLTDEHGIVIGVVAVNRDISVRKAFERELLYNASLQQSMSDAVFVMDMEFIIQSWNKAAEQIYGWTAEEAIGTHANDILQNELTEEEHHRLFAQLLEQGWLELDVIQHHKDRTPINFRCSMTLISDEFGKPISILSINHDITERKEYEHDLLFNASVQASMSDAVIVTNPELRIQSWNKAAELMYGWSAEEAIGKNASEVLQTRYETEERRQRDVDALFGQGFVKQEVIQQHKTKGAINVLSSVTLLKDTRGQPFGVVAVNHDITQSKQAEKRLQESEDRLRTIVENIPVMISFFDTEGRFEYVNQYWLNQVGWTVEDLTTAEDPLALFYPDSDYRQQVLEFMISGESGWRDFKSQTKHRGERITSWSNVRLSDGRSIGIGQDITDRKQSEKALRESEERFRHAILNAPFPIMIHAEDGKILNISNIWTEITGYAHDEIPTVADWTEKAYGERRESVKGIIDAVYSRSEPYKGGEFHVRTKSGDIRVWDFIAAPVGTLPDGRRMVSSMAMDITERKQIEESLRISEEKFRQLIDAAPIATIVTDQSGLISIINRQAEDLFGYDRKELTGQPVEILIPKALHTQHVQHRSAYISEPHMREMGAGIELFARRKDESLFSTEIQLSYVRTRDSIMVISFVVDITERKQMISELERQRVFLREVIDVSPSMIFVKDIEDRFIFVNPAMADFFDTTVEALISNSDTVLNIPRDEMEGFHDADRRVIMQGESIFIEESVTLSTGEVRWVQTTKIPLSSEDGQSVHVLGIFTDITERKEAEIALQQALAKEKELNKLKSSFISTASHQFRTPLAVILASTETLTALRDRLDESQITIRLDRIRDQVNRMKDLMDDVLDLARMQSNQVQYKPEQRDLNVLCREIIADFTHQTAYKDRVIYSGSTNPVIANFDPHLMHHVISNLIHNALKYSEQPVHVFLTQSNREIIFTVKDQGIGIPEQDLSNLFIPFNRASNVGAIEGTGLGLSIVEQAVEAHNGIIDIESKVGAGTTFVVTFADLAAQEAQNDQNSSD